MTEQRATSLAELEALIQNLDENGLAFFSKLRFDKTVFIILMLVGRRNFLKLKSNVRRSIGFGCSYFVVERDAIVRSIHEFEIKLAVLAYTPPEVLQSSPVALQKVPCDYALKSRRVVTLWGRKYRTRCRC